MRRIQPRPQRGRRVLASLVRVGSGIGLLGGGEDSLGAAGVGAAGDEDEVFVPGGVAGVEVVGEVFVAGEEVFVTCDEVVEGAGVEGVVVFGAGIDARVVGGGGGGEGKGGEERGGKLHGGWVVCAGLVELIKLIR